MAYACNTVLRGKNVAEKVFQKAVNSSMKKSDFLPFDPWKLALNKG